MIVDSSYTAPNTASDGKPFYTPECVQELYHRYNHELGIEMVLPKTLVYVEDFKAYVPRSDVPAGVRPEVLSDADLRNRLSRGEDIPEWFTFPEVCDELRRTNPPRSRQGFTVFFTGLSGAGKSTIAKALLAKLLELGTRPVTLLDGDIVRKHLSSELGFSKEHRDINIRRIGYVASEITKNGGIAICAPIAPYESVRREVREMTEAFGGFVLVYVNTPLEICEQRDRKGLYVKARKGLIQNFTGISDPYEPPLGAEVVVNTTEITPEEAAQTVILRLEADGYIGDSF